MRSSALKLTKAKTRRVVLHQKNKAQHLVQLAERVDCYKPAEVIVADHN